MLVPMMRPHDDLPQSVTNHYRSLERGMQKGTVAPGALWLRISGMAL
jgi:hypothetical protein